MGCGRRFLSTDPDTQTRVCRGVAADRSSWRTRAIVATDLGSTLNVIRVRLHRARRALKQILLTSCKDCCPEHGFMNCEGAHGGNATGKSFPCFRTL